MNINKELITLLKRTVIESGEIALKMRASGLIVKHKPDLSPVTDADEKISQHISACLKSALPSAVIICEEGQHRTTGGSEYFWLIDPIDGTRSYIRGNDNFTINIGLIKGSTPYLGFVYAPATKSLHYTDCNLKYIHEIDGKVQANKQAERPITALVGSNKVNLQTVEYIQQRKIKNILAVSSSIKFCLLAAGRADIYPKFGETMEWDTAAGHAVLLASGGKVIELDSQEMPYGKPNFMNNNFIALANSYRNP